MFGKLLIVSLVSLVSKIAPVYAQYALPTFQAVHKKQITTSILDLTPSTGSLIETDDPYWPNKGYKFNASQSFTISLSGDFPQEVKIRVDKRIIRVKILFQFLKIPSIFFS